MDRLSGDSGTTEGVAEKRRRLARLGQNHPSAAKAGAILFELSARMNPRPFKTALNLSFSASCEVVPLLQSKKESRILRVLPVTARDPKRTATHAAPPPGTNQD
jgi:hypothetical protein